ncbi:hypothetical protein KEM54_002101 [Ascosphaera aggregata]|nr:hypothetical protein KEM54_002101 [Ascosphaera aggregata]
MDINTGLRRGSRTGQNARQSQGSLAEQVDKQVKSKVGQGMKAPRNRYAIVPTLSKILFALKPTGQGSRTRESPDTLSSNDETSNVAQEVLQRSIPWTEDQESESDRPPFVAKGRKVRELANVVSEESAQPDENSPHRQRFNDQQIGAHKVSPVDSQGTHNVTRDTEHVQIGKTPSTTRAKRRRDNISDEEREGAFSTPRPYKRSRLTAMSRVEPADTTEDTRTSSPSSNSSQPDDAIAPPENRSEQKSPADKPAPSRPLARPGVRKPWTEEECLALLEGVSMFGSSWSKIKSRDSSLSQPKLSSRSQMNLKDKARQLAFDFYRARKAMPPGLEYVPLQTVKIQELQEMGIEVASGSWGRRRTPPPL